VTAVLFFIFAGIALAGSVGVVLARNPVHAALLLVATLISVAVFFILQQAPLLATVQIIVYAGAIAVLFVFAIMVLIPGKEETGPDPLRGQRWLSVPIVAVFLILLVLALGSTMLGGGAKPAVPGGAEAVGRVLFTDYLFPFEVTSVLLLAAIVGVMALTKRRA
jgi:NADH-quinone oxidoreductase subunit J